MKKIFSLEALGIGVLLMLYFMIVDLIGMADQIELRFFNIVILAAGMWYALYRKATKGKKFGVEYLDGFKQGLQLTFGAAVTFAALFVIYSFATDHALVQELVGTANIPDFITIWHLAAVIIFEGMASGLILSLIMMQYFKYEQHKSKGMELR
ncbi:MAG: hypothetical protein HUJ25_00985 [Crocinitomicaceae bacterium]|nr:hypothetical protein [Crocinitomicaceae bacterium]